LGGVEKLKQGICLCVLAGQGRRFIFASLAGFVTTFICAPFLLPNQSKLHTYLQGLASQI
jgi:hypothetical protein